MNMVQVKGVSNILSKMKQANSTLAKGAEKGLKEGGKYLQRESQAIVPVHLGPLKASAFTRHFGSGWDTDVIVGYTAGYAVYVHENLDAAHGRDFNTKYADRIASKGKTNKQGKTTWKAKDYWHPRGEEQQAKFLEKPAREKRLSIFKIIANEILKGK